MKRVGSLLLILSLSLCSTARADNPTREFVMSCLYGTAAGTLVGAASLAFTSQPGANLNIVARGASIGLYTGILLGLYVVYIVPGLEPNPDDEPVASLDKLSFFVVPTTNPLNRIDGVKADWTVLRF